MKVSGGPMTHFKITLLSLTLCLTANVVTANDKVKIERAESAAHSDLSSKATYFDTVRPHSSM